MSQTQLNSHCVLDFAPEAEPELIANVAVDALAILKKQIGGAA